MNIYKVWGGMKKDKRFKRKKRHKRVRKHVFGTSDRPRLCVFRSNKYIYGQIIDDIKGITLLATRPRKSLKADRYEKWSSQLKGKVRDAYIVGRDIGERAVKAKIKKVVFDRGGYKFTGRVAAFANGARDAGLLF